MYRVIIRRTERKQVWRRIGRSLRRNETKGEDGLTGGEGGKEGNSHALPSTPSSPRLRRRTRWGRQKEIRGELFFSWPPSNAREREREGGGGWKEGVIRQIGGLKESARKVSSREGGGGPRWRMV